MTTQPDYEPEWHHRYLCEKLDAFARGEIKRLIVSMPPRHGKSELVSRKLPAFIFGVNPDASIISCSYGSDLSSRMNRDVQRIIDNDIYSVIFPKTKLSGENVRTIAQGFWLRNSDMFEIVGHKGGYRSAGVGGAINGMGCQFLIIDDPVRNQADADSITYRQNVWEWFTSTAFTRLEKSGSVLLTMTRWHEDDLAGRLLEQAKDKTADQWEVISFPAIKEDLGDDSDPRAIGEALWPSKYNLERLNAMRISVGSRVWNALYQQRPSASEGALLKREWFKFYTQLPSQGEWSQSWDLTFSGKNTSDFVVGQVWFKSGSEKYLVDQVRDRMDFPTTVDAFRTLSAKYPQAVLKLVEEKANGAALIASLKKEISGIVPVNPKGGKESRAHAISPELEAGNIYVPRTNWVYDLIEECVNFPNGKNDDQVDAMTQQLNYWQLKRVANITDFVSKRDVFLSNQSDSFSMENKRDAPKW